MTCERSPISGSVLAAALDGTLLRAAQRLAPVKSALASTEVWVHCRRSIRIPKLRAHPSRLRIWYLDREKSIPPRRRGTMLRHGASALHFESILK
jgi:hypothetical protein